MKFDTSNAPTLPDDGPQVGYIYKSKCTSKTFFWLVVAIDGNSIILLGLNKHGEIVSSTQYSRHVFEDREWGPGRKPIGRVVNMPDMVFEVEWGTP